MSCFDTIEFQGKGFTVSTETNSGCMGDGGREMEKLRSWHKAFEPIMKKLFQVVERELAAMSRTPDAPNLITGPRDPKAKPLERVWEEKMDGLDVPKHMEEGNGPCLYRMRLWPRSPVTKVDIEFVVETLPPVEVRDAWKASLQQAIERDVKHDPPALLP